MPAKLDLKGKRFGRLLVLEEFGRLGSNVAWKCLCDCGKETIVRGADLKSGHTQSCGCYGNEAAKGQTWRRQDLTGKRFGRLFVLEQDGISPHGNLRWRCKCDCGNVVTVDGGNLKRAMSCGCLNQEHRLVAVTKHGGSRDALFRIWSHMKERCEWPKHKSYARYGGRGITVCEEWRHNYGAFKEFALAHGWSKGLQMNRIDNDKGYSPDNVNFVTSKENANNRCDNVSVDLLGEKLTLSQIADRFGLSYPTVWERYRSGKRGFDLIAK